MRFLTLASVILLALAAAGSPASARQQEDPLFDLRFDGGSVAAFAGAIRSKVPQTNILIMSEAAGVPVPAVELRQVTAGTALSVLENLQGEHAGGRVALHLDHDSSGSGNALYSVKVRYLGRSEPPSTTPVTQVLSVGHLLEEVEAESLLTAIETAMELLDEDLPPVRIRFHEETGIVIVRGHERQVETIHHVINQVGETVKSRSDRGKMVRTYQEMEQRVEHTEHALRESESHREALQHELMSFRLRAEMIEREMGEMRDEVMRLRQEKVDLVSQVQSLVRELGRKRE